MQVVDVSYGMEMGLNQAIELVSDCLRNVKLITEKKWLQKYFEAIATDSGKYCFMVDDTLTALEMSVVETLLVWEQLPIQRYRMQNKTTLQEIILYLTPEQEKNTTYFHDPTTGIPLEVIERISLVEWLVNSYHLYGAKLELVTDRSPEGAQFCRGFGGIGGLLRWKVDFLEMTTSESLTMKEDNKEEDCEEEKLAVALEKAFI
jgi:peptide chain release factor subunit 1